MSKILTVNILSVQKCKENPNDYFIFGDNLIKVGQAGQANIRYCKNAIGIPTKRLPSMNSNAFFSDKEDEILAVKEALSKIDRIINKGLTIYYPESGVGTGLAQLKERSPKIFEMINNWIKERM